MPKIKTLLAATAIAALSGTAQAQGVGQVPGLHSVLPWAPVSVLYTSSLDNGCAYFQLEDRNQWFVIRNTDLMFPQEYAMLQKSFELRALAEAQTPVNAKLYEASKVYIAAGTSEVKCIGDTSGGQPITYIQLGKAPGDP